MSGQRTTVCQKGNVTGWSVERSCDIDGRCVDVIRGDLSTQLVVFSSCRTWLFCTRSALLRCN